MVPPNERGTSKPSDLTCVCWALPAMHEDGVPGVLGVLVTCSLLKINSVLFIEGNLVWGTNCLLCGVRTHSFLIPLSHTQSFNPLSSFPRFHDHPNACLTLLSLFLFLPLYDPIRNHAPPYSVYSSLLSPLSSLLSPLSSLLSPLPLLPFLSSFPYPLIPCSQVSPQLSSSALSTRRTSSNRERAPQETSRDDAGRKNIS